MKLAIFDFDGTLTKKDSMIDFIRFLRGDLLFLIGIILFMPIFIVYRVGIISNEKAKEKLFTIFFKNLNVDHFEEKAKYYSTKRIKKILRKEMVDRLNMHIKLRHKVVIVTASCENWILNWSLQKNIMLIGTKLEIKNGRLTGKLASKNCYGKEKINRIMQKLNIYEFNYIYAYGDNKGDLYLKSIADEFVLV